MSEPETPPPEPESAVGSTSGAAASQDESRARQFPCQGCGADLEFHIGTQNLKCPFCGYQQVLEDSGDAAVEEQDLGAMLERLAERRRQQHDERPATQEVPCRFCGAKVQFQGSLVSTDCPWCGSPIQREGIHDATDELPVDGLLPFRIERNQARDNLKAWLSSRWFLPGDLKKAGISEKFQGVYLPFWTYDALTANRYSGQRGETYTVTVGSGKNRRTETRVRWYPASGSFRRFFDDVLVPAGHGLPDKQLQALEPWPLEDCIPYNPEALAGYFSRTWELPLEKGFVQARQRIDAAIRSDVRRRIGGDRQRIHSIDTRYLGLTYKHLLLPVWMLAYRFRDKSYQLVVNAATGEVQGERPWSWAKILLLVLAVLVVVGTVIAIVASQQ